jgi:hypothetical protein
LETGSTNYMTDALNVIDDGEECDETTEEDLLYLKDTHQGVVTTVNTKYYCLIKLIFFKN